MAGGPTPTPAHDAIVVGGGLSGLSTAYYLAKRGVRATIVEKERRLGGLIVTESVDGCIVEGGAESYLAAKPWATELIRELGIGDDLIPSNDHRRKTYIWRGGKLLPLPDGLLLMIPTRLGPVLASPLLGWRTKLRMGLEAFHRAEPNQEEVSVAEFIRRHFGQEAVDYLAEPLLAGVYGGDPEKLSASLTLARFVEWERRYGSLTRGVLQERSESTGPIFQSLRGGMGELIDALTAALRGQSDFLTGEVEAMEPLRPGWRVRVNGEWMEARSVTLACTASAAGELLGSADLTSIEHTSAVTVMFGYRREELNHPLNGFGFLVPKKERKLLLAATWVGTKFDHRTAPGYEMIRCFSGGDALPLDDESLSEKLREELTEKMGVTARPVFVRIRRWPRSMPQYKVGHARLVARIMGSLPEGVHLAGNAYYGVGMPDCVRAGQQAAERISQTLSRPPATAGI
jgi:oxygen-dependent protoporphyrinogen oxidase